MTDAVQVNQEPVAWLVKIRGKGGTLLDMRLDFTKPYIRSDLTAEFIPLVAMALAKAEDGKSKGTDGDDNARSVSTPED